MADTTVVRKCKITTAAITRANFETNKAPSGARAYIMGLSLTLAKVVMNDVNNQPGKYDSTNSGSGGYAEHSYGHANASSALKFQFNQYARPIKFVPGEIRGLIIFLDFDADDAVNVSGGSEECVFIGFVGIDSKKWSLPQQGTIDCDLGLTTMGWHDGDI